MRGWYEPIRIEGGPAWTHDCTGRGDMALLKPVDSVVLYPNGEGGQEYIRTTRTWISPIRGEIHTVFQHSPTSSEQR